MAAKSQQPATACGWSQQLAAVSNGSSSHQGEKGARLTLEAENAEVEFGEVINSRPEDTSLEAEFEEFHGHVALTNVTTCLSQCFFLWTSTRSYASC